MSDEKKPEEKAKDVELKDLSKETLENQVKLAQEIVNHHQGEIARLQNEIQQQIGIAGFAQHLLAKFKIADKPKEEPKKLEVK